MKHPCYLQAPKKVNDALIMGLTLPSFIKKWDALAPQRRRSVLIIANANHKNVVPGYSHKIWEAHSFMKKADPIL